MRHKIVDQMIDATLTVMASRRYTENAGDDLERATQIVLAICEAIHQPYPIYIPAGPVAIDLRNQNIIKEFNGRNYQFLAKKYRLSERQIRRILHPKYAT